MKDLSQTIDRIEQQLENFACNVMAKWVPIVAVALLVVSVANVVLRILLS